MKLLDPVYVAVLKKKYLIKKMDIIEDRVGIYLHFNFRDLDDNYYWANVLVDRYLIPLGWREEDREWYRI